MNRVIIVRRGTDNMRQHEVFTGFREGLSTLPNLWRRWWSVYPVNPWIRWGYPSNLAGSMDAIVPGYYSQNQG